MAHPLYHFTAFLALGVCALTGETVTLEATADATVYSDRPDENFHLETELYIHNLAHSTSAVYLRFDATGLGKLVSIESIEAYALPLRRPRSVSVYLVESEYSDWSEIDITWQSAPANELSSQYLKPNTAYLLGDFEPPSQTVASTVEFGWNQSEEALAARAALLEQLNTGSRTATLVLIRPTDRQVVYTSMENTAPASHPVRLIVDTSK